MECGTGEIVPRLRFGLGFYNLPLAVKALLLRSTLMVAAPPRESF